MKYHIVLIHGTFTPNAPWTDKNSEFCKRIADRLNGNVMFQVFNWSGKNSHKSRLSAAIELKTVLEIDCGENDCKKIIIAHSHGGNIAMYALKELGERAKEFGLITMATPFLNPEKRDYKPFLEANLLLLPFSIYTLILAVVGSVFYFFVKKYVLIAEIITFLACLKFIPKSTRWMDNIQKKIDDKIENVMRELSFSYRKRDYEILAVINQNDEINIWFRLLFKVWEGITTLQKLFLNYVLMILTGSIIGLGILHLVYDLFISQDKSTPAGQTIMIYAAMFSAASLATIIIFLSAIIIVFLVFSFLKSNVAMLGRENLFAQLFIKITPSSIPFDYQQLTFINHRNRQKSKSLRHSIYNDNTVVDEISDWIADKQIRNYNLLSNPFYTPKEILLELKYNELKAEQLMLIFLAAGHEQKGKTFFDKYDIKLQDELPAFVSGVKRRYENELQAINTPVVINLIDDAIVVLCSCDDRQTASRIHRKITGMDWFDSRRYIDHIISKYSIDMVGEKKREKERQRAEFFKLPKRLLAITLLFFLCFVIFAVLYVLQDNELYGNDNSFFAGYFDNISKLLSGNELLMDKLPVFLTILCVSVFLRAIVLIAILKKGDELTISFKGKKRSTDEDFFMSWLLIECIVFGIVFKFQPFENYLIGILYFVIPLVIINGLFND